ncbi:hypothetical protein RGUI_3995 [Rhodovulum sp. P5]|nr:hypothetical protein RGUI_3995 [Rhodovulum sp. P5]
MVRGSQTAQEMSKIRVVLKKEIVGNKPYFILTAFPIP